MTRQMTTRVLLAGAFAIALLGAASQAVAQGCPANSREVSETEVGGRIRVTCRCNSGWARVDTACKPVNEARTQLATRHRDALRGMESSMVSLSNELLGPAYAALRTAIVGAVASIAIAVATKDLRPFAAAGAAALVKVAHVMAEGGELMKTCSFSNEGARTACLNANNFRQIAESSLKQFEATFP